MYKFKSPTEAPYTLYMSSDIQYENTSKVAKIYTVCMHSIKLEKSRNVVIDFFSIDK